MSYGSSDLPVIPAIFFGLVILCIVMMAGFLTLIMVDSLAPGIDCYYRNYVLKGVNGITDQDSGFFSEGDTSTTTLLMSNGEIITLNGRVDRLKLGSQISIAFCKTPIFKSETIKIKDN